MLKEMKRICKLAWLLEKQSMLGNGSGRTTSVLQNKWKEIRQRNDKISHTKTQSCEYKNFLRFFASFVKIMFLGDIDGRKGGENNLNTDGLEHIEPIATGSHECTRDLRVPVGLLDLLHVVDKQQLRWYVLNTSSIAGLLVVELDSQIPESEGVVARADGNNRVVGGVPIDTGNLLFVELEGSDRVGLGRGD